MSEKPKILGLFEPREIPITDPPLLIAAELFVPDGLYFDLSSMASTSINAFDASTSGIVFFLFRFLNSISSLFDLCSLLCDFRFVIHEQGIEDLRKLMGF